MALTAWMLLAAVGACAEGLPQTIGNDPLTRQILSKAAQENGGVTAAVRLGTGQTIELELAPAASSPPPALAPIEGLAAKAEKPKTKKPVRAAVAQLKHVASKADKSWSEKR